MNARCRAFPPDSVSLLPGLFQRRFEVNRQYLLSLRSENLLQNHYLEAGLLPSRHLRSTRHGQSDTGDAYHWGWESPTSLVRGHFLGHWLSAAARVYAATGDQRLKTKADRIVSELAACQRKNGGEWVGSIPEKYLDWAAAGRSPWAPHYVVHKTLMGLVDLYTVGGSKEALDVLVRAARWFHRWTAKFSREEMDNLLDVETGGMLEVWADLYGITGEKEHLDLIERYTRSRLFDPLLRGEDVLTDRHANTTIPEAHGAARAYEVTGKERWRRIVEAYWKCAVTDRGSFCTGGQTSNEVWCPPFAYASRRGDTNQEHCTVYNMIRLADYLFRWTGNPGLADYIEANLYNGILAQQNPNTGMVAYYLPLRSGLRKAWGSATYDFWCCHGTLVQAQAQHGAWIYYEGDGAIEVMQYIPSRLVAAVKGREVRIEQTWPHVSGGHAGLGGQTPRVRIRVSASRPVEFGLELRLPPWLSGPARIRINDEPETSAEAAKGSWSIARTWSDDHVEIAFPGGLRACRIPDEPGTVAFLEGPAVLAGLCGEERELAGDPASADSILAPEDVPRLGVAPYGYRTIGQRSGVRFKRLYEITDEPYAVYFPVREPGG